MVVKAFEVYIFSVQVTGVWVPALRESNNMWSYNAAYMLPLPMRVTPVCGAVVSCGSTHDITPSRVPGPHSCMTVSLMDSERHLCK